MEGVFDDDDACAVNPAFGQLLQECLQVRLSRWGLVSRCGQKSRQDMVDARRNGHVDDLKSDLPD